MRIVKLRISFFFIILLFSLQSFQNSNTESILKQTKSEVQRIKSDIFVLIFNSLKATHAPSLCVQLDENDLTLIDKPISRDVSQNQNRHFFSAIKIKSVPPGEAS